MQAPQVPVWLETVQPLRFRSRESSTSKSTESCRTPGRVGSVLSSSSNYNSRRGPAVPDLASPSGSLTIEMPMEASSTRRVVRPLPAIPSTPSRSPTPSPSTLSSPRSPRPLPSPPSTSPLSAAPSYRSLDAELATMPNITIAEYPELRPSNPPRPTLPAPATNVIPVTPPRVVQSHAAPQHRTPPRPTLPTLVTHVSSLTPPETDTVSLISPLSPQMPTPKTAKRKRMEKLRRHLGEPIFDEAVYARRVSLTTVTSETKARALREVEELGDRLTYIRAAITVGKILDMSDDEESDDEDVDMDDGEEVKDKPVQEDYTWVLENGLVFCGFPAKRYSRKWMHEKGGQRWEESDYKVVLQALRSL
ncbi:hypothetical protein LshimejAT787_0703490 [Lyophyllum shimeji]|uniref:Uncharacterized protein n=1 Tax=Lyophyllum shimeji TaxID=47721 RepID=A0A9P3PQS1_LYOSH|nr:hypothetical protein LshimejAT787_0703490 [Lyophyllum shimeji]